MTGIAACCAPAANGHAAGPQGADAITPTGQDLVRIGLMADVPDQAVFGSIENIMQRPVAALELLAGAARAWIVAGLLGQRVAERIWLPNAKPRPAGNSLLAAGSIF